MFWDRFVALCSEKGIKPNPAASALGISSGSVTGWKNGKLPRIEALLSMADYFHCSVDFLLGRTDVVAVGAMPEGAVVLSEDERILLERYRSLSEDGRELVRSSALEQRRLENLHRGVDESAANAG